jgi:hypothetical protein
MIAIRIPKGDLDLANGTTYPVKGAACARQHIQVALDIFLGEWFLDLRIGISYFRDILIHSPNSDTVRSVLRTGIMKTDGIVAVPLLEVTLDTSRRVATVEFTATYSNGESIPGSLGLNF